MRLNSGIEKGFKCRMIQNRFQYNKCNHINVYIKI